MYSCMPAYLQQTPTDHDVWARTLKARPEASDLEGKAQKHLELNLGSFDQRV